MYLFIWAAAVRTKPTLLNCIVQVTFHWEVAKSITKLLLFMCVQAIRQHSVHFTIILVPLPSGEPASFTGAALKPLHTQASYLRVPAYMHVLDPGTDWPHLAMLAKAAQLAPHLSSRTSCSSIYYTQQQAQTLRRMNP